MNSAEQIMNEGADEPVNLSPAQPSQVIPVIEEQLHITRKVVETGRVHISKKIIEEEYSADVPVFKEEVTVERKKIDEFIEGDVPGIRVVGDTTIIPVIKEVIVKRLLLVEELHITRRTAGHTIPVRETLRREEVTIKRNDSQALPGQINV